jgi:uncharacterized protein with beta-barrel porin domain
MISNNDRGARGEQNCRHRRNFQRALLGSCGALAVTPTASLAQNLVLNPGFETHTVNGCTAADWTAVPAGGCGSTYVYGTGFQHSGTEALQFGKLGAPGADISQTIAVAAGKYSFSFWYQVYGPEIGGTFTSSVGSHSSTFSVSAVTPYTQFVQQVTLPAGTTTVDFATAKGIIWGVAVDDVSLIFLQPNLITPLLPPNAPLNPTNVAAAIDGFINAGGTLPAGFQNLFNLTPQQLVGALSQASGETATGTQQTTFDAMNLFMGVLTDPFIAGRGEGATGGGGATPFAEDGEGANAYASSGRKRTGSERDAYGMITKAVPYNPVFDQRWSVWASGFGGSQTTDGNAALGSNTATSRLGAVAVGADYRFSPFTLAGFALAGGGTNFSVANGGTGRSDLFQAGAFIRHTVGPAYISAALAYGWQDITTDRTVTIAGLDQLHAQFNANAYSGRVEGGYRFVTPWMGIAPYAAGQFTTFDLPAYAEQVLSGANTFALTYASKSVTASRSELGLRTDKSFAMQDSILTLRGRAAWAHDFNTDRNIAATFQTLPGASFVVNGAAQAHDAALATASAELKWRNGWSAAATFEGEFSDVTRSYAGKGVVRYTW